MSAWASRSLARQWYSKRVYLVRTHPVKSGFQRGKRGRWAQIAAVQWPVQSSRDECSRMQMPRLIRLWRRNAAAACRRRRNIQSVYVCCEYDAIYVCAYIVHCERLHTCNAFMWRLQVIIRQQKRFQPCSPATDQFLTVGQRNVHIVVGTNFTGSLYSVGAYTSLGFELIPPRRGKGKSYASLVLIVFFLQSVRLCVSLYHVSPSLRPSSQTVTSAIINLIVQFHPFFSSHGHIWPLIFCNDQQRSPDTCHSQRLSDDLISFLTLHGFIETPSTHRNILNAALSNNPFSLSLALSTVQAFAP